MTRLSKKAERRGVMPRRPRPPAEKTGAKADNLPKGFREHNNALSETTAASTMFVPEVKSVTK